MTPAIYSTREEWLNAAIVELRPWFNGSLPDRIRVTCGFPSGGNRGNVVGECVSADRSADNTWEISIHPKVSDPRDVFAVLTHELIHTTPGSFNHGSVFKNWADKLFLAPAAGNYRSTVPGATFDTAYGAIIDSLGAYPHARLGLGARPKQTTRMLKAVCPTCGYTIRLTQKWAAKGLPTCGIDGDTFFVATEEE
jgi:hypothetical protein